MCDTLTVRWFCTIRFVVGGRGTKTAPVRPAGNFHHVWQSESLMALKMDGPLAKAGPSRDDGDAPVITNLRRNSK